MKNKKKLKCNINPWQRLRSLITFTIIAFSLSIPTELLSQDVNHLYQQAGQAIQQYRFQEAAAIFERAVQLRPGDAEPLIGLGFTYIHLNRLPEAINVLNRALTINPNSSEAHTNMGFAYWQKGNRDRAVQEYSIAIRMDPSNAQAHYNLGNSYLAMGSPATALPFLEKAIQLQPNYMDALVTLGAARINMGDPAGAMKPLRKAVSLNPNRADTRYNLGLALGQSGYMADAAKEFSWLETNNKELALHLRQQLGDAVVRARMPIGDVSIPEPVREETDSSVNLLGQVPGATAPMNEEWMVLNLGGSYEGTFKEVGGETILGEARLTFTNIGYNEFKLRVTSGWLKTSSADDAPLFKGCDLKMVSRRGSGVNSVFTYQGDAGLFSRDGKPRPVIVIMRFRPGEVLIVPHIGDAIPADPEGLLRHPLNG